jgi:hypothetical protein
MRLEHAILLPPTALAFLTGYVWLRLGSDRLREMRERRIHPQKVATAKQAAENFQNVRSADHFRNGASSPCASSRTTDRYCGSL